FGIVCSDRKLFTLTFSVLFSYSVTAAIYTLSLHDALPISDGKISRLGSKDVKEVLAVELICFIEGLGLNVLKTFKEIYGELNETDRKSTRLNSSHVKISYAVFCLKKKKNTIGEEYTI